MRRCSKAVPRSVSSIQEKLSWTPMKVEPLRYGTDQSQSEKGWSNVERRRQRPSLVGGETYQRFHHGDRDCHKDLTPPSAHYRAWVRDHEENEQLIHWSGDRSDLRQHGLPECQRARAVKQQKAHDIGEGDVEHADARNDYQPEDPDHQVRRQVIAELVAEHGDAIWREQQQSGDRKVCRIPQVVVAIA